MSITSAKTVGKSKFVYFFYKEGESEQWEGFAETGYFQM